jgi:hypothetical protein
MRGIVTIIAASAALAACSAEPKPAAPAKEQAATLRPSQAESEAYMRKAEEDWANLAVKANPGLMDRILADDYVGVSSENRVVNKASYLKAQATEKYTGRFVSSKLDYVNYRHFGDTVLAQGAESVKHADGTPDLKLIWTDVWMWRDGKWQVVASQDNVVPPEKK